MEKKNINEPKVDIEEIEFEKVIAKIKEENIEIPEELEERVNQTLKSLPKKKGNRNIISSVAVILLVIMVNMGLILTNDAYVAFASEVPVLDMLVELLGRDKGLAVAYEHNYPVQEEICIEQEGYTLRLTGVMVDEERISFRSELKGPYFSNRKEDKNNFVMEDSEGYVYRYHIRPSDDSGYIVSTNYENASVQYTKVNFGEDTSKKIPKWIEKGVNFKLLCEIYKLQKDTENKETVLEMKEIEIPINKETILLSKEVKIDKKIKKKHGEIAFEKLKVSPTKMQLVANISPIHCDDFDLDEYRIYTDKGEELETPSITKYTTKEGKVSYQIVPSIYFDEVKELMLQYDSYYYNYGMLEYTFRLDDVYPKVIDYHGKKITIIDIKHKKEGMVKEESGRKSEEEELHILYTTNEEEIEIGRMEVKGIDTSSFSSSTVDDEKWGSKNRNILYDISKQESYTILFKNIEIKVKEAGKIKIPIEYVEEK